MARTDQKIDTPEAHGRSADVLMMGRELIIYSRDVGPFQRWVGRAFIAIGLRLLGHPAVHFERQAPVSLHHT